jgi:hypothetical protein
MNNNKIKIKLKTDNQGSQLIKPVLVQLNNNEIKIKLKTDTNINNEENELWKPIKEFDKYEVSNQGRIRNIESNQIITGWMGQSNYIVQIIDNFRYISPSSFSSFLSSTDKLKQNQTSLTVV